MKVYRAECHQCDAPTEDWTCADCGQVRYIGPNCGHVAQPTPVAASKWDGQPVCDACEARRDAAHRKGKH